jgi:hypothetical protein
MATAPMLPFPKPKETKDSVAIPMSDPVPQPGGRKRRGSRRGGFREQSVNTASPVPPTGPQPPLGGRRRKTRKSKSGKRHTRRH